MCDIFSLALVILALVYVSFSVVYYFKESVITSACILLPLPSSQLYMYQCACSSAGSI